jgi:uncharacterized protein YgbK (DUF1537 family)
MPRVGIVADDLTGAADTALQFVRAGWQTEMQLRPGASDAQVLAVTTDSRTLNAADAGKAVAGAVAQLRGSGVAHLYKKIDSTLRGQLRPEVRAAVEAWSTNAIAVVCPAFPEMGRTLVDGRLCVNGMPVSDTALSADPITPVVESHVPTLLGASYVAQKEGQSARSLADVIAASAPMVVVDAANDDQLKHLAEAVALLGPHVIPVGSAGLARHLARAWKVDERIPLGISSEASVVKDTITSRITIVIVTSLQDVARRQAAAVAAAGAVHGQPAPADLIDDDAWGRWSTKICDSLGLHSTLLLTAPLDRRPHLPPELIPERFADVTARIIRKAGAGACGVVVTGGDGARAVARTLDATGFQILGEVTNGVPLGRLVGGPADGLRFVTKAGGFGDADTLLQAVQVIGATDRSFA